MKRIIFVLLVLLGFAEAKAQFPSTDSLRNYNIVWITNNAARAFTNYRLHTLLAGMIDWIDSARAGEGGTIGIDSISALNDSTIRYRKNGTFATFNLKGVYDARRKLDTLYKTSDSTFAFTINSTPYTITMPGRTNFVDSIYRKEGQDSIFYRKEGVEFALKDSTGGVGTTNSNVGTGLRWAVVNTNQIKTFVPAYGLLADSTTNANSITAGADTLQLASWPRLYKVHDTLSARINLKVNISDTANMLLPYLRKADTTAMLGNYIRDANDGLTKTGQVVSITNNGVTDAKLRQSAGLSVIGRSTNSTGNVADITAGTDNQVLRRSGTSLGFGAVNLSSSDAVTGQLAEDNLAAFSPFPTERTYGKIYEKNFWNNNAEDLQVGPSGNNSIAVSGGFITMTATAFNAANIIKIIPGRVSALNKSTLTAQIGIGTLTANAADIGLMGYSVITHSGAQFGYMGFIQTSTSGTSTVFIYDQARSSQKATAAGFAYASNDIVEFTWDLRDTTLSFTAHNLTSDPSGANKKTATYNFTPNSSAHILPNSYNWAIYDGSGTGGTTRTLRYVKIESNDVQYPNLLVLGNSKTKIGYATFWNGRFGMQLNATYPNVVINAGGAERLSDMILRLDEITALSPSQVLLADIASNSIRAGIPLATVVDEYRYIVSRLEGAGIRVLHCILPEDSTAGGLGQTAWHARLSAEYPTTYISEVYDDMSTNNIADAGMINADGIHLVQAGNDQATASIIASGKVQVISVQRRSEIRTNDRWIVKTGDSLHFARKIFSRHNYVPRWDDNNQSLTTGVQFMDSTKSIFTMSSRPASPLTNAMVAVEGPIATYGVTGGRYMYDRTTAANNYAEYVNLNTMYRGYNGTDRQYIGTEGQQSWGNQASVSTTLIPSTINIKRSTTFTGTFGRKGFSFSSDSVTLTHNGSTALGNRSINSFHKAQMAATGSTSYDTLSTVLIEGTPYAGSNTTINFPLALEVLFGRTHLGGGVSILNSPSGYGAYRLAVINPDSTLGTVPASTFATQSALNDTAAAIRTTLNSIADKPWSSAHAYIATTNDATPTNMNPTSTSIAMNLPNNSVGIIKVTLVGNAGAGAATAKIQGVKYYTFNKNGGTLTIDAADVIIADKLGASVSTATWAVVSSSNQPVIQVTGVVGQTINWGAAVEIALIIN